MDNASPELILHHYPISPFSEKVRVGLGIKGLEWRSLEVAPFPPRPHTAALTGDFRRIPILQIGSDLYCDTQIIARELERRFPRPGFYPNGEAGAAHMLCGWSDSRFFMPTVAVALGALGDHLPKEFREDREAMTGSNFDFAQLKAAVPVMRAQVRAQYGWIDDQLADGRKFLFGDQPGWADANAFFCLWFITHNAPSEAGLTEEFGHMQAWAERIRAIGHGKPSDISGEDAVAIAKNSQPQTVEQADPHCPNGFRPGDHVVVVADDYGKDPVEGALVSSSVRHVAVRRHTDAAGDVVMHFPRLGYTVSPV